MKGKKFVYSFCFLTGLILCVPVSAIYAKNDVELWNDYKFGKILFEDRASETIGSKIYHKIIPDAESYIKEQSKVVLATLYNDTSDSIPTVDKLHYTLEDIDGISAKGGENGNVSIFYSTRHIEKSFAQNDTTKLLYETRGVLLHELTHAFQLEPQGIGDYGNSQVFRAFIEGMADAVRIANWGFEDADAPRAGGSYLDGYRNTGYFLNWIRDTKDSEFLRKFNRSAIEVIPWSFDRAIKHVLGIDCDIDKLWQEYQESISEQKSGNPVFEGWYADPEGVVFGNEYWIYPTYSAPYDEQVFIDAFSSKNLIDWTKHPKVLSSHNVKWAKRAMWAPAVVNANGKYYLFFGANDIQNENEVGGIGVAVSDNPAGPFKDALGKPLINKIVNGAQPIDQFVFKDDDGQYYMYYGGWGHCNMVKLSPDLLKVVPFDDGTIYREITPKNYVEGPFMLKRKGKYYFMWSEGGWGLPNYSVAYSISDTPFGPFERVGKILEQDAEVATGAGHHSVMRGPGEDEWYIVYHRRPLGETDANSRVTCIDRLYFDKEGFIVPVKMTFKGVPSSSLNQ